ncbi:hypothetical protein A3F08_00560 [Candidatus Berkelbacteria bacterium RIFCSPHIGHO2_12_FULL_36_9]|uniref:Uncharacterized protein n=1 Tax=Candidatus Berkelbacteria bacterium RIFCSPHIGHO2_12_FULL_36_9 TaxID=1797469 RepID=A0A1F5EHT9_9BACT|nr:MAG: hypothetical protein A3F08_00560 [Candidatus Berkelbacteria bacterium RIFCSPHIGHO2_12_FULL_36_9]
MIEVIEDPKNCEGKYKQKYAQVIIICHKTRKTCLAIIFILSFLSLLLFWQCLKDYLKYLIGFNLFLFLLAWFVFFLTDYIIIHNLIYSDIFGKRIFRRQKKQIASKTLQK